MPLVIHNASVLHDGRTVPYAGLYAQIDVRDISIGLTVSSYPVAVQAHLIFAILQTPKATNHLAHRRLIGKLCSTAAHHDRVARHKPHKIIYATCSPGLQK